jgi:glucoamylase
VTTALGSSRIWATLGYGIIDEVYHPSTGEPQIRDLGFIVAREGEWYELKRVNDYTVTQPEPYVPLPTVTHHGDGYEVTLEVLPDPVRDTLLVRYELVGEGFRLYPLIAPHLGDTSGRNTAWTDGGRLHASGGDRSLCLVSNKGFSRTSVGYVGASDGWQDFDRNTAMTWTYERAEDGNVALMGELEHKCGVLAIGFARTSEGARTRARSSLAEGFDRARDVFVDDWKTWGATLDPPASGEIRREALLSATILKIHEDKSYPGAVTASLSIPWGNSRDDLGGYHLVWTRDTVEAGLGLLAAGFCEDARRMLAYLVATQRDDGYWTQNFYPDSRPHWTGIQLDEVGFPVLLAAKLGELGELARVGGITRMVRRAVSYLAHHGPVTPQDRWEEEAGASPFTLAVEIAALVAASSFLKDPDRSYALSLADYWNERVESWTFVEDGEWSGESGVDGYYVRIAPSITDGLRGRLDQGGVGRQSRRADAVISTDFLYLARLGLRQPDDPRMLSTLRLVDRLLRVETPSGVSFHRYNGDHYGEYDDGRPYDGGGRGRAWPLLTGERGHFALQRGEDPAEHLEAMVRMTGNVGLIPEQVWDSDPVEDRQLQPGKPTGSAMPLVWAHAEFLKLVHARQSERPIELLDTVWERYRGVRPEADTWHWRAEAPFEVLPHGRDLLVEHHLPFTLHVGEDEEDDVREYSSQLQGLGIHGVRIRASQLAERSQLVFSREFDPAERPDDGPHTVRIADAHGGAE